MRVIIAGSRGITDIRHVEEAMHQAGLDVTEVVSGTARGVDQLGERWAGARGIPVARFPAQWERYGRSAGYKRNDLMTRYAAAGPRGGALVAVWDGTSPGTSHTIELARRQGLQVFIHRPGVPRPERALEASHT